MKLPNKAQRARHKVLLRRPYAICYPTPIGCPNAVWVVKSKGELLGQGKDAAEAWIQAIKNIDTGRCQCGEDYSMRYFPCCSQECLSKIQ